ncbi:MAG: HK97 family phage prohead protease [Desulfobacterales bacterium]|nr:HK97 family phage prohead protease [Desulfobacterales bacterium]
MSKENERRSLKFKDAEVRVVKKKDEPTKIIGYFAKFNVLSQNLGGFREIIKPGFFRKALETSETVDLFNHDPNYILGNTTPGTLRVWEDEVGLAYECEPPDTQLIRDMVLTPIERGDLKGNSFGFCVNGDGDSWEEDEDGRLIRTLKEDGCNELFDGSQVTFPAYLGNELSLRSKNKVKEIRNNPEEGYDLSNLSALLDSTPEEKREDLLKKIDTIVSKYTRAENRDDSGLEAHGSVEEEEETETNTFDEDYEAVLIDSIKTERNL